MALFVLIIFFCTAHPLLTIAQPLNVLFIVDKFPTQTKTIIENQALGLLHKGFDIQIVAKNIHTHIAIHEQLENRITDYRNINNLLMHAAIVVCQYGTLGIEIAEHKKKYGWNAKLITCFRGADITQHNATYETYKNLFETGDLFFPVCSYYAYLLTLIGCNPAKISIQRSGINLSLFQFKQRFLDIHKKEFHIVSVHRLSKKKGCEFSLKAIALLIENGFNIRYSIIGSGKIQKNLEKLIKTLNLEKHVIFLGEIPNADIPAILNTADIFILPSVTDPDGTQEGIPNALKEAMAMGIPSISTYHAGIREVIIHKKTGLLVPERDHITLAKAITDLLTNNKLYSEISKHGAHLIHTTYDMNILNTELAEKIISLL